MKLTAQEIMRYGPETWREETLIDFIECEIPNTEELEQDLNHFEGELEKALDCLREIESLLFGDLEDEEILKSLFELFNKGLNVEL